MKKLFMSILVLTLSVFATYSVMAQTGGSKTGVRSSKEDKKEVQERFDKLGNDIKKELAAAEENLKKANDKTRVEAQKAVDKLQKQAKEVENGAKKANEDVKEDWATVKRELNDLADRIEKELKK